MRLHALASLGRQMAATQREATLHRPIAAHTNGIHFAPYELNYFAEGSYEAGPRAVIEVS